MCGLDNFPSGWCITTGEKQCAGFMDLEKAYDRVDWLALWDVLKINGVGGKMLAAMVLF